MEKPEKDKKNTNNQSGPMRAMGLASAIGLDLALFTLGGFYLGSWLSEKFGGSGLWIGGGVLFGIFCAGVSIIAVIRTVMGDNNE